MNSQATLREQLAEYESQLLLDALQRHHTHEAAAESLGVRRSTWFRKLRAHGLTQRGRGR